MKETILKYLKIISIKNPFKLKQLIIIFEDVKREISDIYYAISIECMEILNEKAKKYLDLKTKNSSSVAKNIYEECLNISKYSFRKEILLTAIDNKLKEKYKKIKEECEKKIIILSIGFINEIQNTIETGRLFSDSNLDKDNLSLLSFNINQILKLINSIENLFKDKETLEKKSICLATIVKIEFSMKSRVMSLTNLLAHAQESIDIVDNKLGDEYEKKEWYNEIVDLRNQIQMKIIPTCGLTPPGGDEKIREDFEEKFLQGEEEFLKFLVENYPNDKFNKNYDFVGEYKKNKRKLLNNLMIAYKKYENNFTSLNDQEKKNLSFKKEIILEYLGNLKNNQTQRLNYYNKF